MVILTGIINSKVSEAAVKICKNEICTNNTVYTVGLVMVWYQKELQVCKSSALILLLL